MSDERFPVGARVLWPGEGEGTVVENDKMPGDICIQWDMGVHSSYDEEFLVEHKVGVIVVAKGILLPKRATAPSAEPGGERGA